MTGGTIKGDLKKKDLVSYVRDEILVFFAADLVLRGRNTILRHSVEDVKAGCCVSSGNEPELL
jgi:hypothetical protein